jgi:hypothetical protein
MNTPGRTLRRTGRWIAGAAAAALAVALGSCNIVGGAALVIMGPEKVQKLYDLDRTRPTVVFVDDRASRLPNRTVRRQIGMTAEQVLAAEGKIKTMISSQDMLALTERERYGTPLGIAEMGEAVGAEVVVYVTMDSFTLTADGENYVPEATGRVKVIDVKTKRRLWPPEDGSLEEWHPLTITAPQKQGSPPRSTSERIGAQQSLAERFGKGVAYLFIKHEKRVGDGRIDQ